MSRSDERRRRKAEKVAKFEAGKAALIAKVAPAREPVLAALPQGAKGPRVDPAARDTVNSRDTFRPDSGGSRLALRMSWCITDADTDGEWSWSEPRAWSDDEWAKIIKPGLDNQSQLTWREIDAASSGSGHKMHHGHEVGDICAEAQARWLERGLEQFDTLFRFRIGGQKKRAWGYIVQAHFRLVWWERNHKIYPVD